MPQSVYGVENMSKIPYARIRYFMVSTRPYIAQFVSGVSRYMTNFRKEASGKCQVDIELSSRSFWCWPDLSKKWRYFSFWLWSFLLCRESWKIRSTSRYIFTLVGSVISWKLTLQSIITLSTIEAEYMEEVEAVKEVIWLKGLMEKLVSVHT